VAYAKPITVDLIAFEEELLPSGRKLFHTIFKQKFGTYHYKWTPPWKGDYGVERMFLKALEIEEYNDPEGVWSKELKQVSQEVPSLDEIRLPLSIHLGEMTEVETEKRGKEYRIAVELLEDETDKTIVALNSEGEKFFIRIGNIKIAWDSLKIFLLKKQVSAISKEPQSIIVGEFPYTEEVGVRFYVWLSIELSKVQYQTISREIASSIKSFIRKYISDYKALKRGFEEM
jgi:hypothetical protein